MKAFSFGNDKLTEVDTFPDANVGAGGGGGGVCFGSSSLFTKTAEGETDKFPVAAFMRISSAVALNPGEINK